MRRRIWRGPTRYVVVRDACDHHYVWRIFSTDGWFVNVCRAIPRQFRTRMVDKDGYRAAFRFREDAVRAAAALTILDG